MGGMCVAIIRLLEVSWPRDFLLWMYFVIGGLISNTRNVASITFSCGWFGIMDLD
jgi:hypothetical protein